MKLLKNCKAGNIFSYEEKTCDLVLLVFSVVRFRWNSMSRLEKVYLKNSVMELIANVSKGLLGGMACTEVRQYDIDWTREN